MMVKLLVKILINNACCYLTIFHRQQIVRYFTLAILGCEKLTYAWPGPSCRPEESLE